MEEFCCPNCGSGNVESVKLLYEEGHFTTQETRQEIVGSIAQNRVTEYSDGSKKTEYIGSTPIYGDVTRTTVKKTMLASRLEPPEIPIRSERKKFWFEKIVNLLLKISLAYATLVLILLVVLFGFPFLVFMLLKGTEYALEWLVSYGGGFYNNGILWKINWISIGVYSAPIVLLIRKGISKLPVVVMREKELDEEYKKNCENYKDLYDKWSNSYVCRRCYNIFENHAKDKVK